MDIDNSVIKARGGGGAGRRGQCGGREETYVILSITKIFFKKVCCSKFVMRDSE